MLEEMTTFIKHMTYLTINHLTENDQSLASTAASFCDLISSCAQGDK